jgi:type I restriction enzyme S subunit
MIRTEVIPTAELLDGELRFDAFYYAGGGRMARQQLERAGVPLQRLDEVAEPPFMGLRFARYYVMDPEYGVPFLGPSEMQLAELNGLPMVSRVRTPHLDELRIREGWVLISRSGAIGNFAYVREDMDGLIGSDDLIRIVPKSGGAPGGYLFTYLTSDIGIAMLRRSTYGAVIQHIEPHHIADLPVPRLGAATEEAIHARITATASKRVEANRRLTAARARVYEVTGLPRRDPAPVGRNLRGLRTFSVQGSELGSRLEARFHDTLVREMELVIQDRCDYGPLCDVTEAIYDEHRHKLFDAAENCLPFIGTGDMFTARPKPHRHVSRRIAGIESLCVPEGVILVAKSGQIYSILGDVILTGKSIAGMAVSWHALRVVPNPTIVHPGYLFAFLSLPDYGYGQIVRTAYGTSIPEVSTEHIKRVLIPLPERSLRDEIGREVAQAIVLRDEANDLEDEAQRLLRAALGAAAGERWPGANGHEEA